MATNRDQQLTTGVGVRHACRSGAHQTHTAGLAPDYVQANLAIVPATYADDFLRFCQRNPRPCPVLAVSEPGAVILPEIGDDLDIRTDAPSYRVFRSGAAPEDVTDLTTIWRDDLVTFAIGCSFSFEEALKQGGLTIRHQDLDRNVPMYRTNIATKSAGPFHGPLVVSMRPFVPADAIRAIQITSRYPTVHGAPLHIGLPDSLGIDDLNAPWQGDAVPVAPGELPLFWACGITPQAAALAADLPFFIAHTPGHMLVTDQLNADLAVI